METLPFDPSKNNEPLVLRGSKIISNWPCYRWTTQDWSTNCDSLQLTFRLHLKESGDIPWENEADGLVNSTLDHYLTWRRENNLPVTNPFTGFDSNRFWAYSSYNHLAKLSVKSLINSINWSTIGFGSNLGVNGESSTIWIGSKGAATPCHYDTYGYNLVSQIVGRKLWILFPPKDTENIYPTRIPFEESSVFSEVNIEAPDFQSHPKFRDTCPFVVTLEPGDILYVPYHWWHYVKCLDDGPDGLCISINQWLPINNSNLDSLTEGLTSLLVTTLFPFYQPSSEDWLVDDDQNTEDNSRTLTDPSSLINLVSQLAVSIKKGDSNVTGKIDRWIDFIPGGCLKIDSVDYQQLSDYFPSSTLVDIDGNRKSTGKCPKRKKFSKEISPKDIINSILKPEVIQLIANNLLDKVKVD